MTLVYCKKLLQHITDMNSVALCWALLLCLDLLLYTLSVVYFGQKYFILNGAQVCSSTNKC